MPEITYSVTHSVSQATGNFVSWSVKWTAIAAGDMCKEFTEAAPFPRSRVHVFGTWGGATLTLKGQSHNTAPALTLMDIWGNLLALTSDDLCEIYGSPAIIEPVISGGDETTDLNVVIELGG